MDIKYITVHCADTKPTMDIGAEEIDQWHRQRGFLMIGYHFVIRRDGTLETGRPLDQPGAHVQGHNTGNVGVCLVGGMSSRGKPEQNFKAEQYDALKALLKDLFEQYPNAKLMGHRDFPGVTKQCPCFDVRQWYEEFGHGNE